MDTGRTKTVHLISTFPSKMDSVISITVAKLSFLLLYIAVTPIAFTGFHVHRLY